MVVHVWVVTGSEEIHSWRRVRVVGRKGKRKFVAKALVCGFRATCNGSNPVKEVVSVRKRGYRRVSSHLGESYMKIIMADCLYIP